MMRCDFLPLRLLFAYVFSNLSSSFVFLSCFLRLCCLCMCRVVLYAEDISVFRVLSIMCDTRPMNALLRHNTHLDSTTCGESMGEFPYNINPVPSLMPLSLHELLLKVCLLHLMLESSPYGGTTKYCK